ncbi:unnamed protein product [Amoebophrya sp. A120]|nr:unnamed protein product [Amoebophrya sp. A120]|eukprot:GSA120T00008491001.1
MFYFYFNTLPSGGVSPQTLREQLCYCACDEFAFDDLTQSTNFLFLSMLGDAVAQKQETN